LSKDEVLFSAIASMSSHKSTALNNIVKDHHLIAVSQNARQVLNFFCQQTQLSNNRRIRLFGYFNYFIKMLNFAEPLWPQQNQT
jgi:hypothetical protein